jgi:hypothetical protein
MGSNIPEARRKLMAVAARLALLSHKPEAAEITDIVRDLLTREKPIRKAPVKSVRLTPQVKTRIKNIARDYPKMSLHEIGRWTGVNPGRVSEVLNGKK